MMFLPIKAELGLSRTPVLTILICLICAVVFKAQLDNWKDINNRAVTFCQTDHGRVFNMVLKNVYGEIDEQGCLEFVYTASVHKQPYQAIESEVDKMSRFANMDAKKSKAFATKRLHEKYERYLDTVPENLTTNLSYAPESWSLPKMFTSTFSHADWGHIIGNLIFFFAFAASMEIALGYGRFISAFCWLTIATSVSYSVAMTAVATPLPTIGLSGVVMGMIGLFMFLIPTANIRCFFWLVLIVRMVSVPAWILASWYLGWDIYHLFSEETQSNINFVAHVSGACFGYLFGFIFCRDIKDRINREMQRLIRA